MSRLRSWQLPPAWLVAIVAGGLCVATGALSGQQARHVVDSVGPVLAFLVGVTVLAELSDRAGLFDRLARVAARAARGRTRRLFLGLAVLATLTTVLLSIDTTAVLFTPVVLSLAEVTGIATLPLALASVWLANTASLLLPVSNLTNLLAVPGLGVSATGFAARMLAPELVSVALTVGLLLVRFRRELAGEYPPPPPAAPADRFTLLAAGLCCAAIAPGVLSGAAPWTVALPAAAVLAAVTWWRQRRALASTALPWRLVLLTAGLFLTVTTLGVHGLDRLLTDAAGHSSAASTALGALTSNAVNNLPAFLALSRVTHSQTQLFALLIGTNAGPLVTPWASLATLLWRDRCHARGVVVPAGELARLGLLLAVPLLFASWAALVLT